MSLNSLILTTLANVGAPVAFLNYTGTASTYIRFFEYDNGAGVEADDEEQHVVHWIQIDIFSPGNYMSIVKFIKESMKQAGFKKTHGETELYEEDTKLFHKVLRFYYVSKTKEE